MVLIPNSRSFMVSVSKNIQTDQVLTSLDFARATLVRLFKRLLKPAFLVTQSYTLLHFLLSPATAIHFLRASDLPRNTIPEFCTIICAGKRRRGNGRTKKFTEWTPPIFYLIDEQLTGGNRALYGFIMSLKSID